MTDKKTTWQEKWFVRREQIRTLYGPSKAILDAIEAIMEEAWLDGTIRGRMDGAKILQEAFAHVVKDDTLRGYSTLGFKQTMDAMIRTGLPEKHPSKTYESKK